MNPEPMKLYTEEQVLNALKLAHSHIKPLQYVVDTLTPIELPSDGDVEKKIEDSVCSLEFDTGFESGVKWMRDKIQKKITPEPMNNIKQNSDDYMESIAEELRLNGIEKVAVNGGTININSLGVAMRYDYMHRPNVMGDVYRALSMLGTKIHNEHLNNKIESINTFKNTRR